MKKQVNYWIYTIMVISLIACGMVGLNRMQVEKQYKDIEIAIKYADVLRIADEKEQSVAEVLNEYKELGVTTLLVKELTVASPIEKDYTTYKGLGEVTLVEGYILKFNLENATTIKPDSRYMVIESREVAEQIIRQYRARGIELEEQVIDETHYIEIGDQSAALINIGVGFDVKALNEAARLGFNLSLQLKSWDEFTDESAEFLETELNQINNVKTIYFSDAKVIEPTNQKWTTYLKQYQLGFIEFSSTKQQGFGALAHATSQQETDYKVVRLHTIEDGKIKETSVSSLLERYELALKERNLRVFLFKMPSTEDSAQDIAYLNESIMRFVKQATQEGYTMTPHLSNYNLKPIPIYLAILVGLAAIMVFILFMENLGLAKIGYVLGGIGILGYIGLLYKDTILASKLMALFGSIIFPTYAVCKGISEEPKTIKQSIISLLKICFISLGGALTTIGCLSRTPFALGIEIFLGVKMSTVMPIVLVLIYLIFTAHRFDFKYYRSLLDKKVSYGQLILLAGLAIILYIYISRTGNTGTASGAERAFRQFLDNVLGVRPRTKEFLISYPILLALLYYGYKEKYILIVILAAIGPISLVNTYGHIHTPIIISLIRSGYGILFGIIIGVILIGMIKLVGKVIRKCQTQLK